MWTKRFVLNADCLNALTLNVCQGFFVRSILIDRTLFTERRGYGFSVSITVYIILIKCIGVWVKYKCFWRFLILLAQISLSLFQSARPGRARPCQTTNFYNFLSVLWFKWLFFDVFDCFGCIWFVRLRTSHKRSHMSSHRFPKAVLWCCLMRACIINTNHFLCSFTFNEARWFINILYILKKYSILLLCASSSSSRSSSFSVVSADTILNKIDENRCICLFIVRFILCDVLFSQWCMATPFNLCLSERAAVES